MKNSVLVRRISSPPRSYDLNTTSTISARGLVGQKKPPADLRLVSWPPDRELPRFFTRQPYVFDAAKARDSYIYVIDEGVNKQHPVGPNNFHLAQRINDFKDFPPDRVQPWIFARRTDTEQADPTGLGTCIASKALGEINGVSKNSYLVPVKTQMNAASISAALIKVVDDIEFNRRVGVSVVTLALASIKTYRSIDISIEDQEPWRTILGKLRELNELGVPVVVGAGDDGGETTASLRSNTLPQIWGSISDITIVSAVTLKGVRSAWTQYLPRPSRMVPRIYAPGEDIICAGLGTRNTVKVRGTAYAAAMVS